MATRPVEKSSIATGSPQPRTRIGEAESQAHAAKRNVEQPGPGHDAQGPAQTPCGELPNLVQVRRSVNILPGVGIVPYAAHHLRLLHYVVKEPAPVQEGVGLDDKQHPHGHSRPYHQSLDGQGPAMTERRGLRG